MVLFRFTRESELYLYWIKSIFLLRESGTKQKLDFLLFKNLTCGKGTWVKKYTCAHLPAIECRFHGAAASWWESSWTCDTTAPGWGCISWCLRVGCSPCPPWPPCFFPCRLQCGNPPEEETSKINYICIEINLLRSTQQGKPAFPAEPASPNLQCYGLQLFTASSIILFLLFSVSTVFCSYCILSQVLSLFLLFYSFKMTNKSRILM